MYSYQKYQTFSNVTEKYFIGNIGLAMVVAMAAAMVIAMVVVMIVAMIILMVIVTDVVICIVIIKYQKKKLVKYMENIWKISGKYLENI